MLENFDKYRFDGNGHFDLSKFTTHVEDVISNKESKKIIEKNIDRMRDLQEMMYAQDRYSTLFVLQAMDAAGKDGTISRLISGINPQGCKVASFKKPTPEELGHDFLWRISKQVPRKGIIGVFNRSHYEEVLVTKVHPSYIVHQNLPGIHSIDEIPADFWMKRYSRIKSYEDRLHANGTYIVKFFLHVSKEEQKRRMLDRINNPDKQWKFNINDVEERGYWQAYMDAYQSAIQYTATPMAPWYVIPADDKPTMRALVNSIACYHMEQIPLAFPKSSEKILEDVNKGKKILEAES